MIEQQLPLIAGQAAPTSAAAVANAFLDIQESDPTAFPPIDHMKLQKLLFYAHAWWLAHRGTPLFEEDVHAWAWGPVIPSIYTAFRAFGRSPIVGKRATELVRTPGGNILNFRIETPQPPPPEVRGFLRDVWQSHKGLSGVQLSNATHAPGEPWTILRDSYGGNLAGRPAIPNAVIRDVFKAKLAA